MNRNNEFIKLKQDLEQVPLELEYSATKAIAKAKRKKRASILWKTPMVSFCSMAIIFVLLVNLFPAVALAMSNVPILKNLVSAVAFDPSLKLAVENDYYQIIGESQTKEDVTVNVEYLIFDAGHMSLFFSVDAPVKSGLWKYDLTDSGETPFTAAVFTNNLYKVGELEEVQMDFVETEKIPEKIVFTVTINKDEQFQTQKDTTSEDNATNGTNIPTPSTSLFKSGTDYTFRFVVYPNQKFTQKIKSIPISQWIEIKNQKIYLERLDIFPTHSRLYLKYDDTNSAIINGMDIYFKDKQGNVYVPKKNGVTAIGYENSNDIRCLNFESSFFKDFDQLTMLINGISLTEKDKLYGEIDTEQKTIENMPPGVFIDKMELNDSTLSFTLGAPTDTPDKYSELISSLYYDINGNTYNFNSSITSFRESNVSIFYSEYKINNYQDKKFKIQWIYSLEQTLEDPIIINIK